MLIRHKQQLTPRQLELLQEVVAQRCPALLGRVQSADISDLSRTERETLIDALSYEFTASGLREDSEPNPRGLEIEQLIDIISSPLQDDISWPKPSPPGKLARIGRSAVNLFALFWALSALFLVVLAILGGIAKILGIDPLFLGLPVIVLGLRFIFKSSWITAAIAGISFGVAWFLFYHVGQPVKEGSLWIMATPAAFTFCLLHYLVGLFVKGPTRRNTISVSVFNSSQQFSFEYLYREDIGRVMEFVYNMSERVNQAVYILAFEIDGGKVGGRPLDGPPEGATVRLGREDAAGVDWFGVGGDIVLWKPDSKDWACELITAHWKEGQICWAIFVDERNTADVVSSIQAAWFHCHSVGDHSRLLEDSIGPERKLGMLSYDGNCFFGKTTADCWDFVLSQLQEISEGELEVFEDHPDITAAVNFVTTPGTEIGNGWWCCLEFQSKRCVCALLLEELPPIGLGQHTGIPIKFLCDETDEPQLQVGDRFTLWERKLIRRKKLGEGTVEQVMPEQGKDDCPAFGEKMAIAFPLFVYEPGDITSLHTIESFDAAEDRELEELDVEHGNFLYWDARGVRVHAGIRRTGSHWLQLTSTGEEDLSGLREAVRAYAAAVGVPPEEVDTLNPADAVRRLEEAVARKRGPRRWYQFWR